MKPLIYFALCILGCLFVGETLAGCHRVRKVAVVGHSYGHHSVAVVQAPVYYNVGQGLRDEALIAKAVELTLRRMVAEQQNTDCKTCNPSAGSPGTPNPGAVPSAQGDARAAQIFTASCVRCHNGPSGKGGVDLSDVSKLSAEVRQRSSILAYIGEMPPQGQGEPISQDDADFVLRWSVGR